MRILAFAIAVVLLSGGLDSMVCAALAREVAEQIIANGSDARTLPGDLTDPATAPRNHSPSFFVDEGVLPLGVRTLANLAVIEDAAQSFGAIAGDLDRRHAL